MMIEPNPSCAAPRTLGTTMTRSGPEPSSTVTAVPSARSSGPAVIRPEISSRRPSTASPAAPVPEASAAGIGPDPSVVIPEAVARSVRWAKRSSRVPWTVTAVPAGSVPAATVSR